MSLEYLLCLYERNKHNTLTNTQTNKQTDKHLEDQHFGSPQSHRNDEKALNFFLIGGKTLDAFFKNAQKGITWQTCE